MLNLKLAARSGLVNNFDFFVPFFNKLGHLGGGGYQIKVFLGLPQYKELIRRQCCHWNLEKLAHHHCKKKTSLNLERHLLFHFTKVWPMLICPIFTPFEHVLICWAFSFDQHLQSERYLDNAGRPRPGWRNTPQPYEALCHWTDSCSNLLLITSKILSGSKTGPHLRIWSACEPSW